MTQTMPDRGTDARLDLLTERSETITAAARERAARSLLGLSDLLNQRPELRGVHAPADLAADAIRWSA